MAPTCSLLIIIVVVTRIFCVVLSLLWSLATAMVSFTRYLNYSRILLLFPQKPATKLQYLNRASSYNLCDIASFHCKLAVRRQ